MNESVLNVYSGVPSSNDALVSASSGGEDSEDFVDADSEADDEDEGGLEERQTLPIYPSTQPGNTTNIPFHTTR